MKHSNSSINCYLNHQRDYYWKYIRGIREDGNEHLEFGSFGHEQVELYFKNKEEYIYPDESLYDNLKAFFGIQSWRLYFRNIFKQIEKYHNEIIKRTIDYYGLTEFEMQILTELKTDTPLIGNEELLNGVIDKLFLFTCTKTGKQYATVVDYKFTNSNKTFDDLDYDSQLYIYAKIVNGEFKVPVKNISVAYISIPKKSTGLPAILNNGTYSKAKSQNVLYEDYLFCVQNDNPNYDPEDVNGEYYGILQELKAKKSAYMILQSVDLDNYQTVLDDVTNVVTEIVDKVTVGEKGRFLRKFGKEYKFVNDCENKERF